MPPPFLKVLLELDDETRGRLHRIEAGITKMTEQLQTLTRLGEAQMADLATIQADVAANGDAVASAVTLLGSLAQMLRDAIASGDPAAIEAIASGLEANTQALADAVVANTPAAP